MRQTTPVPPRFGNRKRVFGPQGMSSRPRRTLSRTRSMSTIATRSPIQLQASSSGG